MGPHAAYIWSAYAVAAVILVGMLGLSLRRLKATEAMLRRLEAVRPSRRAAREP